jgi:hypothetical protein
MMDNMLMRDDDDPLVKHRQQRLGTRERWSAAHDAGVEGWLVALGLRDKIQDFRCLRACALLRNLFSLGCSLGLSIVFSSAGP